MSIAILPGSRLTLTDEQVSAEMTGETVILSMRDGQYYGLDRVGTHVWRMLGEPRTFSALVDSVVRAFDVDAARAARDLEPLLGELAGLGLVSITPGDSVTDGR